MWPWEHLAVGYLLVSFWRRWRGYRPPREREVLGVVVGTQLPDLVDKPLAWGTTLLPAGRSLAHSLVVVVPVVVVVYLFVRRHDVGDAGVAFAIGYLSHLPTDALYPIAYGEPISWRFLFWPIVSVPVDTTESFFGTVFDLVTVFTSFLSTPAGTAYLLGEVGLLLITLWVWRRDGWPGLASVHAAVVRVTAA